MPGSFQNIDEAARPFNLGAQLRLFVRFHLAWLSRGHALVASCYKNGYINRASTRHLSNYWWTEEIG